MLQRNIRRFAGMDPRDGVPICARRYRPGSWKGASAAICIGRYRAWATIGCLSFTMPRIIVFGRKLLSNSGLPSPRGGG